MLPYSVHQFNSSQFQIYHQLAKLAVSELPNLSDEAIQTVVIGLSLAKYKNEGLYDQIC